MAKKKRKKAKEINRMNGVERVLVGDWMRENQDRLLPLDAVQAATLANKELKSHADMQTKVTSVALRNLARNYKLDLFHQGRRAAVNGDLKMDLKVICDEIAAMRGSMNVSPAFTEVCEKYQ